MSVWSEGILAAPAQPPVSLVIDWETFQRTKQRPIVATLALMARGCPRPEKAR